MGNRGWWFGTKSAEVLTEAELKNIFEQHDRDGDGVLSREELKEAFKYLGSTFPSWRAYRAIHFSDLDGDGGIDEHDLDHLVKYVASRGYRRPKP